MLRIQSCGFPLASTMACFGGGPHDTPAFPTISGGRPAGGVGRALPRAPGGGFGGCLGLGHLPNAAPEVPSRFAVSCPRRGGGGGGSGPASEGLGGAMGHWNQEPHPGGEALGASRSQEEPSLELAAVALGL